MTASPNNFRFRILTFALGFLLSLIYHTLLNVTTPPNNFRFRILTKHANPPAPPRPVKKNGFSRRPDPPPPPYGLPNHPGRSTYPSKIGFGFGLSEAEPTTEAAALTWGDYIMSYGRRAIDFNTIYMCVSPTSITRSI